MNPKTTQCIKGHHDNKTNSTICDIPFGQQPAAIRSFKLHWFRLVNSFSLT